MTARFRFLTRVLCVGLPCIVPTLTESPARSGARGASSETAVRVLPKGRVGLRLAAGARYRSNQSSCRSHGVGRDPGSRITLGDLNCEQISR
jgi:hypothetical protein